MKAKTLLKTSLLLSMVFLLLNCSKDDDEPQQTVPILLPEVDPLSGYFANSGFNEVTTTNINIADYEFGYSFIPTNSGKINAFVVKIPDANAALRMTLWNKATATVITSSTINYTTAGLVVTTPIIPVDVVAGIEYMVTMNSNDWYSHRRFAGTNATYPVTVGDINITGYSYRSGAAQAIPNTPTLDYYAGDISFRFRPNLPGVEAPKLTLPASLQNTTALAIPDGIGGSCGNTVTTPGTAQNSISITASGIIADPSKISIELDLSHNWSGDFVVELISPGGVSTTLIKRLGANTDNSCGSSADFISGNKLTFNSAFTTALAPPYVTGNYAQTGPGSGTSFPSSAYLTPLSTFLQGKSIKGDWKLKVSDYGSSDAGTLNSWKLSFAEGALQ